MKSNTHTRILASPVPSSPQPISSLYRSTSKFPAKYPGDSSFFPSDFFLWSLLLRQAGSKPTVTFKVFSNVILQYSVAKIFPTSHWPLAHQINSQSPKPFILFLFFLQISHGHNQMVYHLFTIFFFNSGDQLLTT